MLQDSIKLMKKREHFQEPVGKDQFEGLLGTSYVTWLMKVSKWQVVVRLSMLICIRGKSIVLKLQSTIGCRMLITVLMLWLIVSYLRPDVQIVFFNMSHERFTRYQNVRQDTLILIKNNDHFIAHFIMRKMVTRIWLDHGHFLCQILTHCLEN